MSFITEAISKAKAKGGRLVLPEGNEVRTLHAAEKILKEGIAKEVVLVGSAAEIEALAKKEKVDLKGLIIDDPKSSPNFKKYASELYEMRKAKGMTPEEAEANIVKQLQWGAMRVHLGDSDALVAGAYNTTGDVLRSCFQIVKTAPGVTKASSCFVMITDKKEFGANGSFIFADCSTIPDPDSETLAEIAIQSAESCKVFLGAEPKVAMLSYSTLGSAKGPQIDKVAEAVKIVKSKRPDIAVDGEMQLDAAIVPSVAAQKAPGSKVAGSANVLVFPELQSANIGYKLVQRLAGADAFGPILQGFSHPVSDLSRGCSVDDIVGTAAITLSRI